MANNALIQGAALTGKKFLDVGGAVKAGLAATSNYKPKDRVAENNTVKNKVNAYMSKMKTDMDFTGFSPAETKTMRNFLLSQRSIYTDAAKKAAEFDDTTDPDYMTYIDQMQGVNNSFTNLAAQLKSYKEGKLDFAKSMQDGLYSSGNPTSEDDNPIKDASIIYGFYDSDGDGKSDDRYDSPLQIQDGGNIGFNVRGKEITYNDMREPSLKDTKLINRMMKDSETIYNKGTQGGELSEYGLNRYKEDLTESLQNEDSLRSVIFDYNNVLPMKDIGDAIDNGSLSMEDARIKVVEKLVNARKEAFDKGKNVYNAKQNKLSGKTSEALNKKILAAKNHAEYILGQGADKVTLYHPSSPGKSEIYEIRRNKDGTFEIKLNDGDRYVPLEKDNVFGLDITKIKSLDSTKVTKSTNDPKPFQMAGWDDSINGPLQEVDQ